MTSVTQVSPTLCQLVSVASGPCCRRQTVISGPWAFRAWHAVTACMHITSSVGEPGGSPVHPVVIAYSYQTVG